MAQKAVQQRHILPLGADIMFNLFFQLFLPAIFFIILPADNQLLLIDSVQPNIFNFDGCHIDHIAPANRELVGGHPEIDSLNRSALIGQL